MSPRLFLLSVHLIGEKLYLLDKWFPPSLCPWRSWTCVRSPPGPSLVNLNAEIQMKNDVVKSMPTQRTTAMRMARGQMPCCCKWVYIHLEIPLTCRKRSWRRRMQWLSKRSSFSSCFLWRCCHGAKQSWVSPLWAQQLPHNGGMDDILRAQAMGGEQGPTGSLHHPWPRHAPLLEQPYFQPMLPAGPHPLGRVLG